MEMECCKVLEEELRVDRRVFHKSRRGTVSNHQNRGCRGKSIPSSHREGKTGNASLSEAKGRLTFS